MASMMFLTLSHTPWCDVWKSYGLLPPPFKVMQGRTHASMLYPSCKESGKFGSSTEAGKGGTFPRQGNPKVSRPRNSELWVDSYSVDRP